MWIYVSLPVLFFNLLNSFSIPYISADSNDRYLGMPVTVQVVGLPQHDEKVMRAMKIIDGVVNAK